MTVVKIIEPKIFPGSKDTSALDEVAAWVQHWYDQGYEPKHLEIRGGRGRATVSGAAAGAIVMVKR